MAGLDGWSSVGMYVPTYRTRLTAPAFDARGIISRGWNSLGSVVASVCRSQKGFFAFAEGRFLLAVTKIAHSSPLFSQFLTVVLATHKTFC